MQPLEIKTGVVVLPIVRDGVAQGEIKFNPSDTLFAEKFYKALGEMQATATEYQRRAEELNASEAADGNNLPVNMSERLTLLSTTCNEVKTLIDNIFGAGTSAMVFGDANSLDVFSQFFEGITPYFQRARAEKVQKYTNKPPKRGKR